MAVQCNPFRSWHFVMYFILLTIYVNAQNELVVITKSGPVKGQKSDIGYKNIVVFKNIPYAKPPIGNLRFQAPEEMPAWTNAEDIVQNRSASCPQIPVTQTTSVEILGSEDCLLLDIYTTQNLQNQKVQPLPVLVYFHGGLFKHGSKDEYLPSFLMKEAEMIVVMVNYRLGVLGFLSTQDTVLPGNAGLLDQRMALKWVFQNIASFGGNPSIVTIAGHGAGGVSVGLHILSPSSHDYFSAAISASGTAFDPWALSRHAWSNAVLLAKNISCTTSSSANLVRCLQLQPLEKILTAQNALRNITFRPVIDGASNKPFLSDSPQRLYTKNVQKKVPYMAGVTKNEASIEVYTEFEMASKEGNLDRILIHLLRPYLWDTENVDSVVKAAKYHYMRFVDIPSFLSVAPQMIDVMSDFLYKSSLDQMLRLHSKTVEQTYMYVFEYTGQLSLGDIFGPEKYRGKYGVSHSEDVIYLFNTTFAKRLQTPGAISPRDNALIQQWNMIWKNFITYRKPTTTGDEQLVNWPQFQSSEKMKYLQIGSESITPQENYRQSEMDFWSILVPDLQEVGNNNTSGIPGAQNSLQTTNWGVAGLAIVLAVLCVALAGVVVVTRKRFMRKLSMPASTKHDFEAKQSKV